jgi:uncharacterized membrane protein
MRAWASRTLIAGWCILVIGWVLVLIAHPADHVSGNGMSGPGFAQTGSASNDTLAHQIGGLMVYGAFPILFAGALLAAVAGLFSICRRRWLG